MELSSDHPLPTPPSIPTDNYDRLTSPRQSEDPLSASPVLSHPAVIDAFTSDVRDEPPSPATQEEPLHNQTTYKFDIPKPDSSIEFDRPQSEPPIAMDVDENPAASEMVNGHKNGEYTASDMFSGPAVDSPEPTNEPSPPPTSDPAVNPTSSAAPPSMVSGVEQAPNVLPTSSQRHSQSSSPVLARTILTSTPSNATQSTDVIMQDVSTFKATKPFHDPPPIEEPPAKRIKTETTSKYDTSKKLPANQQRFLSALIRQVKKQKDAIPFLQPVDPVKLNIPRYFDIIERPMDISTIERKLNSGAYPVAEAVIDDFHLMIENCVKFNGLDNPVTRMAKNIQATFEKGIKTLPPEQVHWPK
jgi:hypothetical protein